LLIIEYPEPLNTEISGNVKKPLKNVRKTAILGNDFEFPKTVFNKQTTRIYENQNSSKKTYELYFQLKKTETVKNDYLQHIYPKNRG
jgi:hypothetical protein